MDRSLRTYSGSDASHCFEAARRSPRLNRTSASCASSASRRSPSSHSCLDAWPPRSAGQNATRGSACPVPLLRPNMIRVYSTYDGVFMETLSIRHTAPTCFMTSSVRFFGICQPRVSNGSLPLPRADKTQEPRAHRMTTLTQQRHRGSHAKVPHSMVATAAAVLPRCASCSLLLAHGLGNQR